MAACAAALAAVGLGASPESAAARTIDQVSRYCTTSWRNAGIHPQDWLDCTQEAIARLLERVPQDKLDAALDAGETPEHRELKRAVWRTIQRWRRAPQYAPIDGRQFAESDNAQELVDLRDTLAAAVASLSPRQQHVVARWSEGYSIEEIARELGIAPAQASDQKYKAIRKLQRLLADV
jgi:RNA polymerase sigma factor (sigma-70 family)